MNAIPPAQLPELNLIGTPPFIDEAARARASGPVAATVSKPVQRPAVRGKFLFIGNEKIYVKGATYGAFKPDESGEEYHDVDKIDRDFAAMAANGINTVRIPHTMPPRALLDIAARHGMYVMVGLSAEQYVGYLIDRKKKEGRDTPDIVRRKVRAVAGHPALLCYAIGNEISAPVVRWLGAKRVERYLRTIYHAIKAEDPEGLVTYVNYPTTEYLHLPFLDLVCFNVYLESPDVLRAYLLRLQNIVGERPLIMSEVGLDAQRNGEEKQAAVLAWQIRTVFEAGCAGAIIFSWTDEWFRAGEFVSDWAFGLTDAQRRPKPALHAVKRGFEVAPFAWDNPPPRCSVVICTYNGARTIRDSLDALSRLKYPDFEVIVVNDGSTDATESIVKEYAVRLISTENLGLSNARNLGWQAATGSIVAYLDDDAYPDPDWLSYMAISFASGTHAGIGGPNIDPAGDGFIADCVANSPGGPVHVLLTDEVAEHIPGCNMAFRRDALEAVGGFDTLFRVAGDDVDICWKMQARGWTLGYSPAAMVWHHSRNSIRTYCKQQRGYGRAEALLEAKWPEKFNSAGHHTFSGRIYGKGFEHMLGVGPRVYHGVWGSAPFQGLYHQSPGTFLSLPMMPEWYMIIGFLAFLAILSMSWPPLLVALPLLVLAVVPTLVQAVRGGFGASFHIPYDARLLKAALRMTTVSLHLLQPLARLIGRTQHGLTFWRRRSTARFTFPRSRETALWTEDWAEPAQRVATILAHLRTNRAIALCGDEFARWDLEVRGGMFGAARLLMAVEDHGAGAQYVRTQVWGRWRRPARVVCVTCALLAACALAGGGWLAAAAFLAILLMVGLWTVKQCGSAMSQLLDAVPHSSAS